MQSFANYTVYDLKQIIGKDYEEIVKDESWPFKIIKNNDKTMIEVESPNSKMFKSPEEIVFHLVKVKAEEHKGTKIGKAIITVPSKGKL